MPDRSIWVCPSRYRRLSTASVARPLRQNSKPAIADNALFPRLFRASQVYICRKTFGYLLRPSTRQLCGVISRYQGVVAALPEPATEGAKLSATSALLLPAAILCGLSWTWMTVWHPPAERPSRPPPRQDSDQRHGSASPIPLCWMWQKRSWPPHCRSTPELDRVQAHLRHENAVLQAPMAVRR